MNNERANKNLNKVFLPIILLAVVFITAVAFGQQITNFIADFGTDRAFGNIKPATIADLKVNQPTVHEGTGLKTVDFGKAVKVAQLKDRQIIQSEEASLAASLGFTEKPKETKGPGLEQGQTWQSGKKILEINPKQGRITYTDFEPVGEKKVNSAGEAKKIAKDFLEKSGLIADLNVSESAPVRIEGSLVSETSENSNGFEAIFTKNFESYKIINPNFQGYARVIVGGDASIKRLIYAAPAEISKIGYYPVKGRNLAMKLLSAGQTKMYKIVVDGVKYSYGEISNVSDVTINKMSLVYVDDGSNRYLEPYYQFEGEAKLTDGRKGEVGLLINAIKDNYLESD